MNLYEMYVANGMRVGFWVKRRTWGDLCARVTFVGKIEQHGDFCGGAPVRADIFHFMTGTLSEAMAVLPSPGSPTAWQQIPPPPLNAWRRRLDLRRSRPAARAADSEEGEGTKARAGVARKTA